MIPAAIALLAWTSGCASGGPESEAEQTPVAESSSTSGPAAARDDTTVPTAVSVTASTADSTRASPSTAPATIESPTEVFPPPSVSSTQAFRLEPENPQAGEEFAAFFDPESVRGGYFILERWDGATWLPPSFLLESDSRTGTPVAQPISGEYGSLDYAVGGAGPDGLIMPSRPLEAGTWRLCIDANLDEACVRIAVEP